MAASRVLPDVLPRLPDAYANVCTTGLRQGILAVLEQVHPGHAISPTGLPAVARLLNRCAHALVLSLEMNHERGDQPAEFLFPEYTDLGELYKRGTSESNETRTKYREGKKCTLVVPQSEGTRWLDEFCTLHPESVLMVHKPEAENQLAVVAWVEYIAAELLELGGNCSHARRSRVIEAVDVVRVVEYDIELKPMAAYLGESRTYLDALRERFEPNQQAWLQYNRDYGWYHDPDKIKLYAQQYARGEKLPGDDYFFRKHGIRPLQFFGNHRSLDHILCRRFKTEDDYYEPEEPKTRGSIVFSFEVRDGEGVWVPFVCELRKSRGCALFYTTDTGTLAAQVSCVNDEATPQCTVKWTEDQVARFGVRPKDPDASFATASTHKRQKLDDDPDGSQQKQCISSIFPVPAPAPRSSSFRGMRVFGRRAVAASASAITRKRKTYQDAIATLESKLKQEIEDMRPRAIFEDKLLVAAQLAQLHRFGPTLFTDNHPLAVCIYFTATLVDLVSTQNGLPTLPDVLLQMIGAYAPAEDLPYIKYEDLPRPGSVGPQGVLERMFGEILPSWDRQDATKRFTDELLAVTGAGKPLTLLDDYETSSDEDSIYEPDSDDGGMAASSSEDDA
jgi:hypothetical protein